jgi:hypothetical protein
MDNSEELIGTTKYLTLYARYRINRCRYNRVRLCLILLIHGCYLNLLSKGRFRELV